MLGLLFSLLMRKHKHQLREGLGASTIFETLIEILHHILVVVPLPSDEEIRGYGIAYAYDWNRQRQKANRKKIEKYAKMKKRVNKLSKKNRVVKRK